ncbi:UbiA prenyltransferase family [Cristinia sonorae]|uniref:UbiA prenyltransferase family n=1 Tax=Cristinia sonorae TaxID=1940300 RepID=A0A8K0UT87_9AGAR|nr:UbiA prenyltransferase family [Cristinia sonorae]
MIPTLLKRLPFHAQTLHLFVKSDYKTTIAPITLFAIAAAPDLQVSHIWHTIAWVWLHILHFDVANQIVGVEEDRKNKGDRPIPAGRISAADATILRWLLVPICLSYSFCYSIQTFWASFLLSILTIFYNELGAHAGVWVLRNCTNALGFAAFEMGATLIASDRRRLDYTALCSMIISAGILATTYQAQDLKDIHGDRAVGRHTLPIVLPKVARPSILLGLAAWSMALAVVWKLDPVTGLAFMAVGFFTGYRFMACKSVPDDQISFYWYNFWISCVHALPGYYRHFYM